MSDCIQARIDDMRSGRHPASCDHAWSGPLKRQGCSRCGAVCEREVDGRDVGKIWFYSTNSEDEGERK